jgi:hypothetical protein
LEYWNFVNELLAYGGIRINPGDEGWRSNVNRLSGDQKYKEEKFTTDHTGPWVRDHTDKRAFFKQKVRVVRVVRG